jgi:hypothetical protein
VLGGSGLHRALEAVVTFVMILLLLHLAWWLLLQLLIPLGICGMVGLAGAGLWRRYRDW